MSNLFRVTILALIIAHAAATNLLAPEELDSLVSILESFPELRSVAAWDEFAPNGIYYGGSWPTTLDLVCSQGPGWAIHGILCDDLGHIVGLRLYVKETFSRSWAISTSLLALSMFPSSSFHR